MKTLLFATLLLFVNISITLSQNFPGKEVNLLIGKKVIVKTLPLSEQYFGFENFYTKFDTLKNKLVRDCGSCRPFPIQFKLSTASDYKKMVGRSFIVTKIITENDLKEFEVGNVFVLELKNDTLGTIYYSYKAYSMYENDFELIVDGGIEFPMSYYCNKIDTIIDEYTNAVSYFSETHSGINFSRFGSKSTSTNIYLSVNGPILDVSGIGCYIVLSNGQKIVRASEKIDVDVSSDGWTYSCMLKLTPGEVLLLKKFTIKSFKLNTDEQMVSEIDGKALMYYVNCMNK